MFEKIASIAGTAAAPLIAVAIRNSRRARLRHQVEEYTKLADLVEPHDVGSAADLRAVARQTVEVLVRSERRALTRRFEGSSLAALIVLVAPAVGLMVWASGRTEWWRWLILVPAGVWGLLWLLYGLTQVWKAPEDAS